MTNDKFLEKLAHLPKQLSSLPWWQQNLLEESKSSSSAQPRPSELEHPSDDAAGNHATEPPSSVS